LEKNSKKKRKGGVRCVVSFRLFSPLLHIFSSRVSERGTRTEDASEDDDDEKKESENASRRRPTRRRNIKNGEK